MKILKFTPFHFTLFLILGIIAGNNFKFSTIQITTGVLITSLILITSYFIVKQQLKRTLVFTVITYLCFFCLGISSIHFKNHLNGKNHYTKLVTERKTSAKLQLRITKLLKPTKFYKKYEAVIISINNQSVKGKILVNLAKNSNLNFDVDYKLLTYAKISNLDKPKNPHQFNYKEYLIKKNIFNQLTLNQNNTWVLNVKKHTLNGYAQAFRNKVNNSLKKAGFKPNELGVINALLLGQRQEISQEITENYAKAGAIHILAISGLHVGIILFVLNFLLKPLERFKNGNSLKLILIIAFLWIFAFIAGMSASVVRAVTMFTAVAFSMFGNRNIDVKSSLVVSMFFLLLFNPYYLFDVGFQLSYLAVFFIVWLQPLIQKIWNPKFKVLKYFWSIFTVSLAAQIGVLPLSLYYFHQFPSLFFATNLVVIPVLGFILVFGFLVIFLSVLGILPPFLADFYQKIVFLLNNFIEWIATKDDFVFQNIPFSVGLIITSYLLIIFSFRCIETKNTKTLQVALFSLLLIQSVFIFEKYQSKTKNHLIVFNSPKSSLIANRIGENVAFYHSADSLKNDSFILKSYKNNEKLEKITKKRLKPSDLIEKDMLVIDSLGVYNLKKFSPKYVLLTQSPKINLQRLIDTVNPEFIIADNSNYNSFVTRWKETCKKNNIKFHSTKTSGAFILK